MVHESSVNFKNLIRDLAEMYPFEVAEVIFAELVANALDSRATRIAIDYDSVKRILTVTDNGTGMTEAQFDEYHDFAAGLKTRGADSIGFAGVGAKISFNIADRVITETRSDSFSGGSDWYLKTNKKLVWEEASPVHLKKGNGTRIEVRFHTDPPYSDRDSLVKLLKRHYFPLIERQFLTLYSQTKFYSSDLRFMVNGVEIEPIDVKTDLGLEEIKVFFPMKGKKRIGFGILGLSKKEYPVEQNISGVFLCTHGKVIKADFFNQFPGEYGPRMFGLVEIPEFIKFLTTSKTDFIRGRGVYRRFESFYGPVRNEFKEWLEKLGVASLEKIDEDKAKVLEREIRKIIDDVPELSQFFGFRTRKQVLQPIKNGAVNVVKGEEVTFPNGEGKGRGKMEPLDAGPDPGKAFIKTESETKTKADPISRKAPTGPKIRFADDPERLDLSWTDGNTIMINIGHPAHKKCQSSAIAKRLYYMFAIAHAVYRFLLDNPGEEADLVFVDRMMKAWGKK